jgi:hypothetical protein
VEARLVASRRLTRDVVRDVQAELLPGRTNKVIVELSHSAAQLVERDWWQKYRECPVSALCGDCRRWRQSNLGTLLRPRHTKRLEVPVPATTSVLLRRRPGLLRPSSTAHRWAGRQVRPGQISRSKVVRAGTTQRGRLSWSTNVTPTGCARPGASSRYAVIYWNQQSRRRIIGRLM